MLTYRMLSRTNPPERPLISLLSSLNSSKTEFLLTGLSHLSKIDHSSLSNTHSTRKLGFIFAENLSFLDLHFPNLSDIIIH